MDSKQITDLIRKTDKILNNQKSKALLKALVRTHNSEDLPDNRIKQLQRVYTGIKGRKFNKTPNKEFGEFKRTKTPPKPKVQKKDFNMVEFGNLFYKKNTVANIKKINKAIKDVIKPYFNNEIDNDTKLLIKDVVDEYLNPFKKERRYEWEHGGQKGVKYKDLNAKQKKFLKSREDKGLDVIGLETILYNKNKNDLTMPERQKGGIYRYATLIKEQDKYIKRYNELTGENIKKREYVEPPKDPYIDTPMGEVHNIKLMEKLEKGEITPEEAEKKIKPKYKGESFKKQIKEIVKKEKMTKELGIKKPVVKKPIVKKPVVKKPIVKKPVVKKPRVKKPKPERKKAEIDKSSIYAKYPVVMLKDFFKDFLGMSKGLYLMNKGYMIQELEKSDIDKSKLPDPPERGMRTYGIAYGKVKPYTEADQQKFMVSNYDELHPLMAKKLDPKKHKLQFEMDIKITLNKHQKDFIVNFINSYFRGALMFHTVGAGKTLTAVAFSHYYLSLFPDRNVCIISPPTLLFNFVEGMKEFGLDIRDNRFKFETYQKFIRAPSSYINDKSLLIIDEVHNFRTAISYQQVEIDGRNEEVPSKNKVGSKIIDACMSANKILAMTGTPFVNQLYDIENTMAMINKRREIGLETFNNLIKNPETTYDYFKYRISHFDVFKSPKAKYFPEKREKYVPIILDPFYNHYYINAIQGYNPFKAYDGWADNKNMVINRPRGFKNNTVTTSNAFERNRIWNDEKIKFGEYKGTRAEISLKIKNDYWIKKGYTGIGDKTIVKPDDNNNKYYDKWEDINYPEVVKLYEEWNKKYPYEKKKYTHDKFTYYDEVAYSILETIDKESNKKYTAKQLKELPKRLAEKDQLTAFRNAGRQFGNIIGGYKIKFIIKKIKENPTFKTIVYSSFIQSSITPLRYMLTKEGIKFTVITGSESAITRQKNKEKFNQTKSGINVLLISKAGTEGVSTKNVRQLFLFESQWNEAGAEQAIARAIRFKSHNGLPADQNYCNIYRLQICSTVEDVRIVKDLNSGVYKKRTVEMFDLDREISKDVITLFKKFESLNKTAEPMRLIRRRDEQNWGVYNKSAKAQRENPFYFDEHNAKKDVVLDLIKESKETPIMIRLKDNIQKRETLEKEGGGNTPMMMNSETGDIALSRICLLKEVIIESFIKKLDKNVPQLEDFKEPFHKALIKAIDDEKDVSTLLKKQRDLINKIGDMVMKETESINQALMDSKTRKIAKQQKILAKKNSPSKYNEYFTPPEIVAELLSYSDNVSKSDIKVLEPSAGFGNMVRGIMDYRKKHSPSSRDLFIDMCEISEVNRRKLKELYADTDGYTFNLLKTKNYLEYVNPEAYDLIVMNPPFHLQASLNREFLTNDVYDIDFVIRAYKMLKPGGELLGVVSNYLTHGKRYAEKFLEEVEYNELKVYKEYKWAATPEKGKESSLTLNFALIHIRKPEDFYEDNDF